VTLAAVADNVRQLFRQSSDMPDGALVNAAREGQTWAQEALFKRYVRMAVGQSWRLIPGEDPEDLAQDALVHALTNLHTLEQPQAFAAWLSAIIVRLAMTRLRKKHLLTRIGLRGAEQIDPEAMVSNVNPDAQAQLREVYAVLATLPPEERTALVLRRVEGLELKEIAEQMGLSLATVKRRLTAAEALLQSSQEDAS
jgi:RNA polymerase sigma-70 factor (ECF subfamily)